MMERWRSHVASGTFELSVPIDSPIGPLSVDADRREGDAFLLEAASFWTLPYSFWRLPEHGSLMKLFEESSLVIFKGDLK